MINNALSALANVEAHTSEGLGMLVNHVTTCLRFSFWMARRALIFSPSSPAARRVIQNYRYLISGHQVSQDPSVELQAAVGLADPTCTI